MDDPQYLIRKGGYYYRSDAAGYTLSKAEAGRYTLADAVAYSHPNGPDGPRDGITYELDDSTAQPDAAVERVADAIEAASVGYSITLTKLVDGEAEYTATVDGQPPKIFPGHEEASEYVDGFRRTMKARAALAAMQQQAPVAEDVPAKMQHWFFKELNDDQRRSLFAYVWDQKLADEATFHSWQRKLFSRLIRDITQPQPDAAVAVERKRRPRLPALSETLYETYPVMSAQTHEAYVKEYAREAVDAAIRAGGQPS